MGAAATQRFECRDPHERFAAQIEDHRIPARRRDLGTEPAQAFATEVGAGVLRGGGDGAGHVGLVGEPLHRAARDQPVVETLVQAHIRILQVDQVQPRRRPGQALTLPEAFEEAQLGRPVEDIGAFHRVAFELVEHPAHVSSTCLARVSSLWFCS